MTKTLGIASLIGALLGLGGDAVVLAQGTQGPGSFGGELRGITRVKGHVVYVACTLKEAKAANPAGQAQLYEFAHGQQRAVFQVTGINEVAGVQDPNEAARWQAITGLHQQVPVRMEARLWRELTAEENLHKEVELIALLRSDSVLDVSQITSARAE